MDRVVVVGEIRDAKVNLLVASRPQFPWQLVRAPRYSKRTLRDS
jgi:hypothetical protein